MVLHVIPVSRNARDVFPGMDAIVTLVPINFPGLPFKPLLQNLYDVTQAEAKVANLLNGFLQRELAANGGVSVETIRTHMKGLFAKTGASRPGGVHCPPFLAEILGSVAFSAASKRSTESWFWLSTPNIEDGLQMGAHRLLGYAEAFRRCPAACCRFPPATPSGPAGR